MAETRHTNSVVGTFRIDRIRTQNSGIDPDPIDVRPGEDRREVVKRFLDENPEILTDMGRIGAVTEAFGQVGDEWATAWKAVEHEIEHDLINSGSREAPNGTMCPCCGREFDYLPDHLPACAAE